jgi:flagellar export protein FliJ
MPAHIANGCHDIELCKSVALKQCLGCRRCSSFVKPATRLDVVVKLRERDEEQARAALAESERAAKAAAEAARRAAEQTRKDSRTSGSAALWVMHDAAHGRALHDAAEAEKVSGAADQHLVKSRSQYSSAYKRAETIRRVAETRRSELIAEIEGRERKEFDEIGVLLHVWS